MKTKRCALAFSVALVVIALLPTTALAAKGSNDFSAALSVSDTTVSAGTTVKCSIKITNTDPTYGADCVVYNKKGQTVASFYLGPSQSRTVTDSVLVKSTVSIYYSVYASHGPDISKTKNTNTVTVTVEQADDEAADDETDDRADDFPQPADGMMGQLPDIEFEPVQGVPKSGELFILLLDEYYVNGTAVESGRNRYLWDFSGPITVSGRLAYYLPDSIAADYADRDEADRVTLYLECDPYCMEGMEVVASESETQVVLTDDGMLDFEFVLETYDIPALYDEIPDTLRFRAWLTDPTTGRESYVDHFCGLTAGPVGVDDYSLWMDNTYFNGERIDPEDVIDVEFGEMFTISQTIGYASPDGESALDDRNRVLMEAGCSLNGHSSANFSASTFHGMPDPAEGELSFDILVDGVSSYFDNDVAVGLHTGLNEITITCRQYRENTYPLVDNSDSITLTINVVDEEGWGDPEDEPSFDDLFEGFAEMNFFEWLGLESLLADSAIELTPDESEGDADESGEYTISGQVEFTGPENTRIRISGSDGFGEPLILERATPDGLARYSKRVSVDETTVFDLTAELFSETGSVLATDTESVTVAVDAHMAARDYLQRYSLTAEPSIINEGDATTLFYSLSNEYSGETVHVRLTDLNTDTVVFEDTSFELFEMYDGDIEKMPDRSTMFSLRAEVLAEDGTVLWEQIKNTIVEVLPAGFEDDGEDGALNLTVRASDMTIAPGGEVSIFGRAVYSDEVDAAIGDINLSITDQDGHVLCTRLGVSPGETIDFRDTYILDATTTFAITGTGVEIGGDRVVADRDMLTITVDPDAAPEEPLEDDTAYDMAFSVEASETVVAPGQPVEITAALVNRGIERVSGFVVDTEDAMIFGGAAEWLNPDECVMGTEVLTFDETTTVTLQGQAWIGAVPIYSEDVSITIVVDPSLAEPEDDGVYGLDMHLLARELTIALGETVDVFIDVENTGSETVDIRIDEEAGGELMRGDGIAPGEWYHGVLHWEPERTSLLVLEAKALDEHDAEVYRDTEAVSVAVTEPAETAAVIDLVVEADRTEISRDSLDGVTVNLDVANTGTVPFAEYTIIESVAALRIENGALLPGDVDTEMVGPWLPTGTTTVVFVVQAYDDTGSVIVTDTEALTVTVRDSEAEAEASELDGPETEAAAEGPFGPAEDSGASLGFTETVYEGGMEISLVNSTVAQDSGMIRIINREQQDDKNPAIYKYRRWIAVIAAAIIIALIVMIVLMIVISTKRRNKKGNNNT